MINRICYALAYLGLLTLPAMADSSLSQLEFDSQVPELVDPMALIEAIDEPQEAKKEIEKVDSRGMLAVSEEGPTAKVTIITGSSLVKPSQPEIVSPPAVVQPRREKIEELRKNLIEKDLVSRKNTAEEKAQLLPKIIPATNVRSDEGNESTITSFYSWQADKKKGCGFPSNEMDRYKKSHAIAEILARLTGSDVLAEGICSQSCEKEDFVPMVESLAVADMLGGTFTFKVGGDGQCQYLMEKPAEKAWSNLEIERYTCSCVPLHLPQ